MDTGDSAEGGENHADVIHTPDFVFGASFWDGLAALGPHPGPAIATNTPVDIPLSMAFSPAEHAFIPPELFRGGVRVFSRRFVPVANADFSAPPASRGSLFASNPVNTPPPAVESTPVVETTDDSRACVVCLSNLRDHCCFPCRHMAYCGTCVVDAYNRSKTCPVCRKTVSEIRHIFL